MVRGKSVLILLVEDNPAHAEIIRRDLEAFRLASRIIHVEDGQAALDYLFRQGSYAESPANPNPDLILLDLRMPKVDGLEVLRQIKVDPRLVHIPVVVLTTSDADADIDNAYRYGAGSYLVKPMEFTDFMRLLTTFGSYWLASNSYPV